MTQKEIHDIAQRILKISIAMVIVWYIFRVMHWPFGYWLQLISHLSLSASYLVLFFTRKEKTVIDYGSALIAGLILMNILYPIITSNPSPFRLYHNLLLLFIILPEGYHVFTASRKPVDSPVTELENYEFGAEDNPEDHLGDKKMVSYDAKSSTKLSSTLLGVGVLPVLFGFMFKVMHWPYASTLLISGFLISALGVFLLFMKK